MRASIVKKRSTNFLEYYARRYTTKLLVIDSLQTTRMKLWDLKQKENIHDYIKKFKDI